MRWDALGCVGVGRVVLLHLLWRELVATYTTKEEHIS